MNSAWLDVKGNYSQGQMMNDFTSVTQEGSIWNNAWYSTRVPWGWQKKSLFMTQTCSSLSISIHGIKEHIFFLHFVIPETFSVLSAGSKTYHVVQIKWINVRLISRTCKSVQKGIILPSSRLQMRRGLWDKANNFLTSSNYVIPPTTTTFSHILDALREKNPSCVISCVSDDKSLALTVCH